MKISDHLTPSLREAPVNDSLTTPDGKTLKELARPGVISEEQIRRYITLVPWRAAKDGSHEYTLFEWVPDSWPYFAAFVQHIRNHGYPAYFYGGVYEAYDIDGMRYWTMGYPIVAERPEDQTILINRALNLPGDPHRQPNYPVREK
jgi:hypothetical protein